MKAAFTLLALLVVSSGYFVNESFAEVSENQAFLLEGSGFAVTEEIIKISEIDIGLSSQKQSGSTINFLTEDGFITLNDKEFLISNLDGKFLREGKYIRINGEIESSSGFDTSISFFGRLVEESKDASIYGFTGRITTSDDTYKVIYTTKLSSLSKIDIITTESKTSDDSAIHILLYSSVQKTADDITPGVNSAIHLRFFSQDRISIEPGASITIVNDDLVSHSILSGKENSDRYIQYTADGRISTGEILPGESTTITFDDAGFYRLYDPDYQWMGIVAYVFPASDSLTFGKGQNLGN
ncbi:MAG: cupredoxin domain-containing protein [Candidatus Nitrosopumilus sp. Bin_571-38]|mgnify:FL=1|jgi:plastocyanin